MTQSAGSPEASESPDAVSVYDFLFHDARRVGSFLAQLNSAGQPQSYKRTSGTTETAIDSSVNKSGFNLGAAAGGREATGSTQASHTINEDTTFDPLWVNALNLLEHLEQQGLINRDVKTAPIGSVVLATGAVRILNMKLIEPLFSDPNAAKMFGLIPDGEKELSQENALNLALVRSLPHLVQAHLVVSGEASSVSWMTLPDEHLVSPAGSLSLRYATWLHGEWSILAIKDANVDHMPADDQAIHEEIQAAGGDWHEAANKRHTTPLGLVAEMVAPIARRLMGRPGGFYGLTPILIFRDVSGRIDVQKE